jgi:3-dehydroshikimate dehydratase
MNLSICTISLRHHLISLEQIAEWASNHGFQGIELWGVHAKNLERRAEYNAEWLSSFRLSVPMVSDYLPVDGDHTEVANKAKGLCQLTKRWGAKKLRTFAGGRSSARVSKEERKDWVKRIKGMCAIAADHGVSLVVETHPDTLADTPSSTLQLVDEIDHPALRINFDVIHVWESGANPVDAFRLLSPVISHLHLKNITARERLQVFAPANVYAPAGDRSGMVNLFQGACDFEHFLRTVMLEAAPQWETIDASLEWFGANVFSTLEHDSRRLRALESERRAPSPLKIDCSA